MKYISTSPLDTMAFAAKLSEHLTGGDVIAFDGGLGMGKTCFTTGLANGLGYTGEVNSPTFAIINEYIGGRLPIWHFDMYRVEGWEDLYSTGYFDYLEANGVTVVEWSENIESALPDNTIRINIEKGQNDSRIITVTGGIFDENFEY